MAKLPNGNRAIVDIGKLKNYCLNPNHIDPRPGKSSGADKARLFSSMLGLQQEDAEWLRERLLEVADTGEATPKLLDQHGQRYEIRFPLTGKNGKVKTVISAWIIDAGGTEPRLTSCYPDEDKDG